MNNSFVFCFVANCDQYLPDSFRHKIPESMACNIKHGYTIRFNCKINGCVLQSDWFNNVVNWNWILEVFGTFYCLGIFFFFPLSKM